MDAGSHRGEERDCDQNTELVRQPGSNMKRNAGNQTKKELDKSRISQQVHYKFLKKKMHHKRKKI